MTDDDRTERGDAETRQTTRGERQTRSDFIRLERLREEKRKTMRRKLWFANW